MTKGYSIPWVGNNDATAARSATEHLLDRGCRNILFITSYLSEYGRHNREAGYREALTARGIFVDRNYMLRRTGADPTPIETEMLVYDFLQKKLPVDGILASSEPAALGALYALKRAGLSVPQDVKIVSYDNTLYSLLTTPPLTSVERNTARMAQKACQVLMQMIDGQTPPQMEICIPTDLVIRESTAL